MSKKHLSHDQKRRAKLAQRAKKHPAPAPSQAYKGNKFKTPELTPVFLATETGIVESDAISRNTLTDRQVRAALEKLLDDIRARNLKPVDIQSDVMYRHGEEVELITTFIRMNWMRGGSLLPRDDETMIGVLRTLLNSIETFTTPAPASRGYLSYVTGFLRKMGVRTQLQSSKGEASAPPADPFVEIGEAWVLDHDMVARGAFLRQAAEMIRGGQGERVAEVAQMLMGQGEEGPATVDLMHVSLAGQRGEVRALPG